MKNYLFIFLVFVGQLGVSQNPLFKNYTPRLGLPSSEVYHVMQDSKGFIWFSTSAGVSRFDGYKFKNFNSNDGLSDNVVFQCYEDTKGRIWFRTFSGKLSYFLNDTIFSLAINDKLCKHFVFTYPSSIFVDKDDTVWLGSTYVKGEMVKFKLNDPHETIITTHFFSKGFYIYDHGFGNVIHGLNSSALDSLSVFDKTKNKSYRMEVPTGRAFGVVFYKLNSSGYLFYYAGNLLYIKDGKVVEKGKVNEATTFFEDDNNDIWVGTSSGILCYRNFNFSTPVSSFFKGVRISSIKRDREGGIWIASTDQGVFYIPDNKYLLYKTSYKKVNTLTSTYDQRIVAGLNNGDLEIISPLKNTVSSFGVPEINQVVKLKDNNFLLLCQGKSMIVQEKSLNILKSINYGLISGIQSDDGLWVLARYQLLRLNTRTFQQEIEVRLQQRSDIAFEDYNKKIWIGSFNGLWCYNREKLEYWGAKNKWFQDRVVDIKQSPDSTLWIATKDRGIIAKRGNSLYRITEKNGLTSNICKSLYVDSNEIWVATNDGLSRIDFKPCSPFTYQIFNYNTSNSLVSGEVNQIAKLGKSIWIATNDGIITFDHNSLKAAEIPSPVYITNISVNGKLKKTKTILELNYKENYLAINFVGLSFKSQGNLSYKFRMEGLDTLWKITKTPTVQYASLPPGDYKFSVYAINSNGLESKTPAILNFSISPPFWATPWFIIGEIILAICLIALIFIFRIKQLKRKDDLQRKILNNELMALRAQMNPHFIFNSLNSVQRFILENDPDKSQQFLTRFARLIRYVTENSNLSSINLQEELNALELYLELESTRLDDKFNYSIEVSSEVDLINTKVPTMLIQPYIENAIWHGLAPKDDKGKILIKIEEENDLLKCIVEDDGIGRTKSEEIKSRNNLKHKSLGMGVTLERLNLINSQRKKRMSVNIIDLKDTSGNSTGTRIEIFIPLN